MNPFYPIDLRSSAFLLDLDGVFYNDATPIPGGAEVIKHLRARGIPFPFVTNTTSKSRAALARKLAGMGIFAEEQEIFSPRRRCRRRF